MKRQEITTSLLPAGYRQLNYIESTGTQYIEFPLNVPAYSYFEMDFEFIAVYKNIPSGEYSNDKYFVFGSNNNIIYSAYYKPASTNTFIVLGSVISGNASNGGYTGYVGKWSRVRFTTTYGNYIWNENLNGEIEYLQSGANRHLKSAITSFRLFKGMVSNYSYPIKIIKNRITIGSSIVMDLYAALRISDNKPGLYDLVNDVFYTNSGTGEFLYE